MANLVEFPKGHVLFKEGDNPDALYIIESGKIVITKKRGSVELELVVLEKGQVLGEMGFFDDKTRSASAKAITEVKAIEIKYDKLRKLYEGYPDYFKSIISSIVERLRRTNNRVKLLEQSSATIDYSGKSDKHKLLADIVMLKVCTLISFIGSKSGEEQDDGSIKFQYSLLRNNGLKTFEIPMSRIDAAIEALEQAQYLKVQYDEKNNISDLYLLEPKVIDNYIAWASEEVHKTSSSKIKLGVLSLEAMKVLYLFGKNGHMTTLKIKNPKDQDEWIDKEVWELNIVPYKNDLKENHGIDIDKLIFKELILNEIVDDVVTRDKGNILVRYNREKLEFLYTAFKIQHYKDSVSVGERKSKNKREYR